MKRRHRSIAEQMYWDKLSPRERVAFTIGFAVGQGHPFPTPVMIRQLRIATGVMRPPRAPAPAGLCAKCLCSMPPRAPGTRGRPPTKCPSCRGVA